MTPNPSYDHGSLRRAATLLRRGGAALLGLALLAISLVALSSYQHRLQFIHDQAQLRLLLVQETLDRQGSLLADYLERLAAWREETPRLILGAKRQQSGEYNEYALNIDPSAQNPTASIWLRSDGYVALPRVASILYLVYRKHQVSPWIWSAVLFDRKGSFVASYPPRDDEDFLKRILAWPQISPANRVAWSIQRRQDGGPCDCLLSSVAVDFPGKPVGELLEIIPLSQLDRLFSGVGWFALLDGQQVLYTSAGSNLSAWAVDEIPHNEGATEIDHLDGSILLKHKLRYMPWTLLYSPTRQGESGPEWRVLPLYALPWLLCVLALTWAYLEVRRWVLVPTEAALSALQRYQQQLTASNQTLRVAKEQAEQASQARSLFLAVMSHEIRTPLNGMTSMLELLERGPLNPRQRYALDLIKTSSDLLLHVIGDILDFARIQSGRVEFALEPVWPLSLVHGLVEAQRASLALSAKPVTLSVGGALDDTLCLLLDPYRMRQILGNLLSNALKFTEQGSVQINLDYREGQLTIEVRDSGIGMTPAQVARLFQPFVQADATTVRQYGGSGLGLAIIKGLLDQSGGHIEVESQVGQGSLFRVQLPCVLAFPELYEIQPKPLPPIASPPPLGAHRPGVVLVVEDHPINRATLGAQLQTLGVNAHFVPSGVEALDYLARQQDVALVLTDISMPEMDGFELTAHIKARAEFAALPVVALSAHAFASDIEQGMAAGMADYLTKPVTLAALSAMLARFNIAQTPVDAPDTDIGPDTESVAANYPLDTSGLVELFKGDRAAVRGLIERFIECDQDDLLRLCQAWEGRDLHQLAQIAHRMGSAALYVDAAYAQALYALEQQVQTLEDARLGPEVEQVVRTSQQLRQACQAWLA